MVILTTAWTQFWAAVQGTGAIYLVFFALEHGFPARKPQSFGISLFKIQLTLVYLAMTALLIALIDPIRQVWTAELGGPLIHVEAAESWPARFGLLILWYIVADFFYYWFHRSQHLWPVLWHQHKLHHADPDFNVTASGTHHFLEGPLKIFLVALPMGLLTDLAPLDIGLVGVIVNSWAYFIHANLRVELGPLTRIIGGPQYHRLHHSILPQHRDRNFAAFFPMWDVLFGTYVAPLPKEFPETGIYTREWPRTVLDANLWPFRSWWAMATGSTDPLLPRWESPVADTGPRDIHAAE
jgi:sterol desaturase/sphingolipid hydroxylase (fatty acid hydroxylase superfamily)